ncbi:hypothetical protein [Methylobacterium sp. J-059]
MSRKQTLQSTLKNIEKSLICWQCRPIYQTNTNETGALSGALPNN